MPPSPSPEAPSGSRPLRRDAERNRVKILAAAKEVFAREGLDATLDQIAEEAGVGIATIYRRFPDKLLLIDALFEERIEQVVGVAEHALTIDDGWDALVYFLEHALELFAADRGLVDALFQRTMEEPGALGQSRRRLNPLVDRMVVRAKETGRLRADVDVTDLALFQLMISLVVRLAGDVSPRIWSRYLTILLDGLRSDRRRPTPFTAPPLTSDELDEALARGGHVLGRRGR